MSFAELLNTASRLQCSAIEVRNDLGAALFDGLAPEAAREQATAHGVDILAVAQVSAFNDGSLRALDDVRALADIAARCGARGVSLIPRLHEEKERGACASRSDRSELSSSTMANEDNNVEPLVRTLQDVAPVLHAHGLQGFIEPLGFRRASLRFKSDAVAAIDALPAHWRATFKLVHDTFHHYLAEEDAFFPEHTGLVHVSGVPTQPGLDPARSDLQDAHRELVKPGDRLGNLEQLEQLSRSGYKGFVSVEAFAPSVHQLENPEEHLLGCFNHIGPSMRSVAA